MKVLKEFSAKKKRKYINVALDESELNAIQEKAQLFCRGNTSFLMRYAALNFTPRKDELVEVKGEK